MAVEMIGLLSILGMFLLMFLRIPIGISMIVPAMIGIYYLQGWTPLFSVVETIVWSQSYSYLLTAIPMFVLMGQFIFASGISDQLFSTFRTVFAGLRGNLAISTIGASSMFAAASGSSVATTSTMGVIAYDEMTKRGYNNSISSGSIAAGGVLGILIPPSTVFILYGMLTEQSIGKLFIAGIIPGIALTILFIITIMVTVKINPNLAPESKGVSFKERVVSIRHIFWIALLFGLVIGGIYLGFFTPTESAGVGALGALLIAAFRRKLTWKVFSDSLSATLKTTGFIFAIVIGAFFLNHLLTITRLPMFLSDIVTNSTLPPLGILMLIILIYILLGAVMDTYAMLVITIPIFLPVIEVLGYDLIWFGVLVVLLVELALITPPIGMNCFVLAGVIPGLKLETIFKGALLFVIPILVLIMLIIMFPQIVLYLPNTLR